MANTKRFDPRLLHFFQHAQAPDMRDRAVPRAELAGPDGGPAALRVPARARVAACAGGEDGRFAGFERGFGDEEDELEARCGGECGCHSRIRFFYGQWRWKITVVVDISRARNLVRHYSDHSKSGRGV